MPYKVKVVDEDGLEAVLNALEGEDYEIQNILPNLILDGRGHTEETGGRAWYTVVARRTY